MIKPDPKIDVLAIHGMHQAKRASLKDKILMEY